MNNLVGRDLTRKLTDFQFMPERRTYRKRRRLGAIAAFFVGQLGAAAFVWVALMLMRSGHNTVGTAIMLFSIAMMVFIAALQSAMFVCTSDVSVSREGIHLELFPSRTVTIPRSQFNRLKVHHVRRELPYRSDVLTDVVLVSAPGLTVFHALASLYFGMWLEPVFIITPDHDNYLFLETTLETLRDGAR